MKLRRFLLTVLLAFGLMGLLVAPARAELFFEGQIWGEEFEDGPGELPQLELFQTINDERFAAYEEVMLVFQLELLNMPEIPAARVRIRSRVFKADGSSVKLPLISASVQESLTLVQRSTEVVLERGDVIRWRVRSRGVPTVAQDGGCQIIVGAANKSLTE